MCIKIDAAIPFFLYPPPASNVDRVQTVGQGRVGTGQHLFVLYWTGKLPLDTSAWTAFQEGGMRTQIISLAQVACCKFIRQWGTSGMHADIKHGEVDGLMTFRARPEQEEASPL